MEPQKEFVAITFQPMGSRITVRKGENVLQASRTGGITVRNVCGGKGLCGKCKVIVKSGSIDFKVPGEENLLSNEELSEGYVLACQTRCFGDCEVLIPPESRVEGQQILTRGQISKVQLNLVVWKEHVDQRYLQPVNVAADLESKLSNHIQSRFSRRLTIPPRVSSRLKELHGHVDGGLTLMLRGQEGALELVDVEAGDRSKRSYGIAVDIGTTKVVTYLVNLVTGDVVDVASDYNRQLVYGEDVVSRVGYTMDREDGGKELQKAALDTINGLIRRLTRKNGIQLGEIIDATVAGNTIMIYLLSAMDSAPLLEVDASVAKHSIQLSAENLGLDVNQNAIVYCLPCVSRFLGGDAVGDVLASGLHDSDVVSLLIDIGTNVEIVLGSRGWLLSTSAAAGPAFEGWGIKFGTRSVEGAIERVRVDPETLKTSFRVIGSTKPKGICGSGLIDAMAEMFRVGILDIFGKIRSDLPSQYVRKGPDGFEYVICHSEETTIGQDITITQRDIDVVVDSKSSACAAISVLLKKMKLTVSDIKKVYVCGAFGSYLDPDSAVAIGLLPEFPQAKHVVLGNGSVAGAYMTLLSLDYRKKAEKVAELTTFFDMLKDMDFMDEYQAGFILPGKKELFPHWWEASRRLQRRA